MGMRREPVASDRRFRSNRVVADYGPDERWQHSRRALELTERAGIMAARATEEHLLDALVMRGVITCVQREAALRLKLDFRRAGLEERLIGSYNPSRTTFSPFGSWNERTDAEEAAYRRWRNALCAMGKDDCDPVMTIVCYDVMPDAQAINRVCAGLQKLVKWYRMEDE